MQRVSIPSVNGMPLKMAKSCVNAAFVDIPRPKRLKSLFTNTIIRTNGARMLIIIGTLAVDVTSHPTRQSIPGMKVWLPLPLPKRLMVLKPSPVASVVQLKKKLFLS